MNETLPAVEQRLRATRRTVEQRLARIQHALVLLDRSWVLLAHAEELRITTRQAMADQVDIVSATNRC